MDILSTSIMDRTSVNGLCRMHRLAEESAWGVYGKKKTKNVADYITDF